MDNCSLLKLQSGTDVRGIAVETKDSPITLTDEAVYKIVRAFLKWLALKCKKTTVTVAVGNDVRISADRILAALKKAIADSKCNMIYTGLCTTPSTFMLLQDADWHCDGSIMITASHLPYNRNGLKFFTKSGGLDGNDIRDILLMADGDEGITGNGGTYEERSYLDTYCKGLIDSVRRACGCDTPLSGKKIIVDAGNGAGGFFAKKVLEPLGANTDGSQFLEPDGTFPNHIPNPEDKQAIDSLKDAVLKNKAHLGIIFDTDVDRAGAVDKYGDEINRNRLIALISAILLKDKKGTIVTDSVTSDGLSDFITNLGGKHVRYMRGYKHVIDEAVRRNALGEYCPLAIETSGHAAFKDNYFLDDGCYLVTRILICLSEQAKKGEDLAQLTSTLRIPKEEAEIRLSFNIPKEEAKQYGNKVIADLYTIAAKDKTLCIAPDNYEGIRINFNKESGDGWALVRMSVHDPIMPINIESDMVGGNKIIATKLLSILEGFPSLNTQNLINFVKGD